MFSSKSWSITRPNVYRRSNEDALDSVGGRLGPFGAEARAIASARGATLSSRDQPCSDLVRVVT